MTVEKKRYISETSSLFWVIKMMTNIHAKKKNTFIPGKWDMESVLWIISTPNSIHTSKHRIEQKY